ncbi:DUF6680 family protein [Bradyrhizobium cajani]|uniref:DUF6680 domain-containing protein n=1 Tax=Bradyrhizobium cajani TaxID=1928661 RepID=A0A844T9W5_9BRAD|nr:DUF6680 family protein [Bradyrhizobium cajani]MCP3370783.1 hypothetical protein [Bradyrhizobium cajani]MVT75888.1 hypothetical protein [Bradyrhizobium cajani]
MSVEWWVVFVTLAGPILAVQTQKFIERAGDRKRRREAIFVALMANRATRISPEFVRGLNLIDIEFLPAGFGGAKDRKVIDAWQEFLGELTHGTTIGADQPSIAAWNQRCEDKVVELLYAMSVSLNYSLTREQLRRGIYHPQGAVEREQAQLEILHGLRKLLTGQASIPMAIKELPTTPEFAQAQVDFIRKAAGAYDEKSGALRIKDVK